MSERAIEFVEVWVSEQIRDQPTADPKVLAAQCLAAAKSEGIPEAEIKDAFEDLAAFIAGEIEESKSLGRGG
jgi:hypothetical protein